MLEALQNIYQIAAVPGLDILLIWLIGISLEVGIFTSRDHPSYQNALHEVSVAAKHHGRL